MNLNEMATAVSQELPITIVLFDNDVLDRICSTKEQWPGDFIDTDLQWKLLQMCIHIRCIIVHVSPAIDMRFLTHTLDEEKTCKHHADLDRNHKIEQDRENESCK